jgi:hypothetical protein
LTGAEQYAVLYESNALANRYTYATAKLDRGDMYPDALAVAGGDPRLNGVAGITAGESIPATDPRAKITFAQSQQAAFNIEGVPAYDNIFIIMEENKSTDAILGNARAPFVNKLLNTYNQLTTYYSTGNPSEPNYTALGGADDFGITDDNWLGCGAVGANAPTDAAFAGGTASDGQPLPATGNGRLHLQPHPGGRHRDHQDGGLQRRQPERRLQHHGGRQLQHDAEPGQPRHQPQRAW